LGNENQDTQKCYKSSKLKGFGKRYINRVIKKSFILEERNPSYSELYQPHESVVRERKV